MLCHTLMMMSVSLKSADVRPDSVGSIDSDVRPVRCHWEDEADASLCDEVLQGIEDAWTAQVDGIGWPEPILDIDGILDVYVSQEGGGGAYAYGEPEDVDPGDGRMGTAAYIVIDPDFDTDVRWTMLHEFNHVLQYSIDFAEPNYVAWEGTATAMEYWSDRSLWPLAEYVEDFQAQPWAGLLGDSWTLESAYDIWSYYEYGAALWFFYLESRVGDGSGAAVRDLWLDGVQETLENEPDFVDAIGMAFDEWTTGWLEFAIMRISVGSEYNPSWASPYEAEAFAVHVEDVLTPADLPAAVAPERPPLQTGAVYWRLEDVPAGETIRIAANGDPATNWAVFEYQKGYGSWKEGSDYLEISARGGDIVVGAINLGASGFDADDVPSASDVVLDVWAYGEPDEGGAEKSGGCTVVGRGRPEKAPASLVLLAGVLGTLGRRKR